MLANLTFAVLKSSRHLVRIFFLLNKDYTENKQKVTFLYNAIKISDNLKISLHIKLFFIVMLNKNNDHLLRFYNIKRKYRINQTC